MFAAEIRRKMVNRMRAFTHWRWCLDEVYIRINGVQHYLWRAGDHEGEVLESFVTKEWDTAAALRFIRKAPKRHGSPKAITTDGLLSYKAALREVGAAEKQEVGRWANNRVENSRLPFRRRERAMTRFRRMHTSGGTRPPSRCWPSARRRDGTTPRPRLRAGRGPCSSSTPTCSPAPLRGEHAGFSEGR